MFRGGVRHDFFLNFRATEDKKLENITCTLFCIQILRCAGSTNYNSEFFEEAAAVVEILN